MKTLASAFALTSLVAAGASATPIGPNLLANGSFESGPAGSYTEIGGGSNAITGWTTVMSGVEYFAPAAFGFGPSENGTYAIDLDNYVYTGGGIAQTTATAAGQHYQIDFWGTTDQSSGRDGTGNIDLSLNGALAGSFHLVNHAVPFAWTEYTLDFTAAGASTNVQFSSMDNPFLHFAELDNVVMGLDPAYNLPAAPAPAVPEPASLLLMAPVLAAIAFLRRRSRA